MTILVRVPKGKSTNRRYLSTSIFISIYILTCFRELTHAIVEAWQIQNLMGVADRLQTQERVVIKYKGSRLENGLLLKRGQSFVLFRPSSDWMMSMHIIKCNLLYSKSTYLNVSLIPKHLTETPRITFDQISGHTGPDTLTHKINHYSDQELLYWQFKNKGNNGCGLSRNIACHLSDREILSIDLLFNLEVLLKHIYFRICKDTLKKGNQILYPNLHNLKITALFQITWFKALLSIKSVLLTFAV